MIDLEQTLLGGQCFGWSKVGERYCSVIGERVVSLAGEEDISSSGLASYFDMGFPYEEAKHHLSSLGETLKKAISFSGGLHILNQDPWEATISFILSQNNNIIRIRRLYRILCRSYGTHIQGEWYAFPTRVELERATVEQLRQLGFGYRAKYVVAMAKAFHPIPALLSTQEARARLLENLGVGPKVADCILLYGYHRFDTFPMDTWMKKVMRTYFPRKESSFFAPYQALAQQYLYQAARAGVLPC